MNWTELLDEQIRDTYRATYGLLDRVDDDALDWKPPTGRNWMTTGQLLAHITTACGMCCQGFVTGDWGLPEGVDASAMAPEEMLPPAEKMPAVESVAQARDALRADEELARRMVARAGEQDLASRRLEAPWAPGAPDVLGRHTSSTTRRSSSTTSSCRART